ncbi:hypothetical protein DFH29DRAFT_1084235 [Suillus ampliporus]|nr:hypothetical protein DFH29DRAFT_1084235 [Suillus ampliporus]
MANTPGATAPNTPPSRVNAAPKLKSTPNAVGSAVISEHISTVGVHVDDIRPWIARDVENFRRCGADTMLQELLHGCKDTSVPPIEKSKLFADSLKAVERICNDEKITEHVKAFAKCTSETTSYSDFVKATNAALLELQSLNVPGLTAPRNDDSDILFHYNDYPITQMHQDQQALRKPDVVVVSCNTATTASGPQKDGKGRKVKDTTGKSVDESTKKRKLYMDTAAKKPQDHFKWGDVTSTLEFKRKRGPLAPPPDKYKVKEYVAPKPQYLPKDADGPVEPTNLAPGPAAASSNQPSSQSRRTRGSESQGENKRTSDHLRSSEPASKRIKSNNDNRTEEKDPKKLPPNVQNGIYVAEMFAANIARQHVISYVVNNDVIYMWYFDRQDAIQCAGINFVDDLPRFLVLLLAMQRMSSEQWGLNAQFKESCEFVVDGVDLKFDLTSDQRTTHFGLRGRATTVFPVESKVLSKQLLERGEEQGHFNDIPTHGLVAKLYWPEESRESEAQILKKVYEIAQSEQDVKGHVPEMIWCHKFEGTSTAKIRRALGMDDADQGSRVLYIIVFKKLLPITTLSGVEFLMAWWEVVRCHYALWKKGVRHRDVSPSNIMVYKTPDGRFIGVLNDYDLSSTQCTPRGNERTGTVPFMAISLLTPKAIAGKVEHLYRHDAESLVWVLVWVCVRYEGGELLSKGRPLDDWLKADATGCLKEKSDLCVDVSRGGLPRETHVVPRIQLGHCSISSGLCPRYVPETWEGSVLDDKSVFETWFEANVKSSLPT